MSHSKQRGSEEFGAGKKPVPKGARGMPVMPAKHLRPMPAKKGKVPC